MVCSLSQEAVDKITRLNRQAYGTACGLLVHYLDPNVPEVNS